MTLFGRCYKEALSNPDKAKAELASRCETVLNTTMAEMDIYHTQKVDDFERLAREHLDGEIRLYEQILTRLENARQTLTSQDPSLTSEPLTPSHYTRDLFPFSTTTTSTSSASHFSPYTPSIITTHKFIPSSTPTIPLSPSSTTTSPSSATLGTLGVGEILIPPLPQPTPHVFDSAPMRPVSVAVQGTVGVVVGVAGAVTGGLGFTSSSFGGGGLRGRESQLRDGGRERETGRGSVFGRLWS